MLKNLKLYYLIITLPFILLLGGGAAFYRAIALTITRNPHPQINFIIFLIILIGGVLVTMAAHSLVREAGFVVRYTSAIRDREDHGKLVSMTSSFVGDTACLLQLLTASSGRSISHQEQAAIEHEMNNTRARLTRRNSLPQYLSGLLVGMGLLGTFIGLLATLSDISTLISSFAELDMNNVSPIAVFRVMIERMKAPMQSMGIAFSASMYGLLGSIILGLMMVGLRRLQGDILSLLGSEVARHIETALSYEAPAVESPSARQVVVQQSFDSKSLVRIEERLAETLRVQQRMLSSEIEDFHKQRADMLGLMAAQIEAENALKVELHQIGLQIGTLLSVLEKGASCNSAQLSEITVAINAGTNESKKQLAAQLEEQKKLRETIDSMRIEERLSEAVKGQQRMLSGGLEDFRSQRSDMLAALAEQAKSGNSLGSELQQLGRRIDEAISKMENGSSEVTAHLTDLKVNLAADAGETHKLLTMQVNEQKRLADTLGRG